LAHRASSRNDDDASIHHSSRDLDGPRKERLSAKCDLLVLAREELEIAFSSESALARRFHSRRSREFCKELFRSPEHFGLHVGLPELCIGALIFHYSKHAGVQVVEQMAMHWPDSGIVSVKSNGHLRTWRNHECIAQCSGYLLAVNFHDL